MKLTKEEIYHIKLSKNEAKLLNNHILKHLENPITNKQENKEYVLLEKIGWKLKSKV